MVDTTLNVTIQKILEIDQPFFYDANPLHLEDPLWKPFDNPTNQLLTIKEEEYIKSNGKKELRLVNLGPMTMDLRDYKLMLTKDL